MLSDSFLRFAGNWFLTGCLLGIGLFLIDFFEFVFQFLYLLVFVFELAAEVDVRVRDLLVDLADLTEN